MDWCISLLLLVISHCGMPQQLAYNRTTTTNILLLNTTQSSWQAPEEYSEILAKRDDCAHVDRTVSDNSTSDGEAGLEEFVSVETSNMARFIITSILIPLVAIVGCVFNIFNIFILTTEGMQNSINYYLLGLSFADLWYLLVVMINWVFNLLEYVDESTYQLVILSMKIPIMQDSLLITSGKISNVLIVILSMERFIAVKCPMTAKMKPFSRYPIKIIAVIFIFVTLLLVPNAFKREYALVPEENVNKTSFRLIIVNTAFAMANTKFYKAYVYIILVALRIIPVFLVAVLNMSIIITLNLSGSSLASMQSSNMGHRRKEQTKITRMLIAIAVIFLVCVTPGFLHVLFSNFLPNYNSGQEYHNLWVIFFAMFALLDTFSSTVNFVVYVAMSKKFRVVCMRRLCQKDVENIYTRDHGSTAEHGCSHRSV